MSWVDRLSAEFIITTGDGKQYKPLWEQTAKAIEFNIAEFEFPGVFGTLVKRGKAKGRKFPMQIYFQGDNCLDDALAFEKSSYDSRPWKINHPQYNNIIVQPTDLQFDYSSYNIVKISGGLIETITDDNPKTTVDPSDNIMINKDNLDATILSAYTSTPSTSDVTAMSGNNQNLYKTGVKTISLASEAENYFNLFNTANASISTAVSKPIDAMRDTQAVINAPALFTSSVNNRMNTLSNQFQILRTSLSNIVDKSTKQIYESQGGTNISAQALAASNPIEGDYGNKNDVLSVISRLSANYNQYITDLDALQTNNNNSTDSYIPDANSMIALSQLIDITISSLYDIALSAKQERTIYCEEDTNAVLLTHRFYSLDPFDNNLQQLINNNNIGLDELLLIKKGRKIVYYI